MPIVVFLGIIFLCLSAVFIPMISSKIQLATFTRRICRNLVENHWLADQQDCIQGNDEHLLSDIFPVGTEKQKVMDGMAGFKIWRAIEYGNIDPACNNSEMFDFIVVSKFLWFDVTAEFHFCDGLLEQIYYHD